MDVADSVLDLIGGTPLVRLRQIGADLPCPVVAKLETTNPGGSVKDRPALSMIEAAEARGELKPGGRSSSRRAVTPELASRSSLRSVATDASSS